MEERYEGKVRGEADTETSGQPDTFGRELQNLDDFARQMEENQEIADAILGTGTWYFEYDETGSLRRCVWGKNFRRMLGYEDGQEFPASLEAWQERIHPDDRDAAFALYQRCLDGQDDYKLEFRLRKRDGSYGWFRDTARMLRHADGRPRSFLGAIMDVTQERENRHLQSIISSVVSTYFATYAIRPGEDSFLELSAAPIRPKDYPADDRSASHAMNFIAEKCIAPNLDRTRLREFLDISTVNERLRGEKSLTIEFKSMEDVWCTATIIPVSRDADGNVLEYVLAFKEISQEKEAELQVKQALEDAYKAANRASSAKSSFLSNMSHDIRTPMNAIIGMTAIACTHIDDRARVLDCLNKITISSKHLLGLINEVLDMSKIESGKVELNMEEFDLAGLVDNLITMTRPQIDAHRHELIVNIHSIEHEAVIGDSQRIQQSFMNLMGNAIKYTPPGGRIRLTITEKPTNERRTGCYEFIFEDNGIGMSEEYQKHMFEPFSRADDTRVTKEQGTGLGMPIARNIVRMMNGDIEVESELGKGTRITATIYLKLQDTDGAVADEMLADLPVLVADDDEASCESACEMLEELGMVGEWVLSGREAVERVVRRHERADDYFAVILDWRMPDMDGVTTARAIRAAAGPDVPIIIISAYDWSDIEREARLSGVNAFISKPLFKSRMAHTLKSLLHPEQEAGADLEGTLDIMKQQDFSAFRALLAEDNELNAEIALEILKMSGLSVDLARDGQEAFDMLSQAADDYYDIVFMDIQMPFMNGYEVTRALRALDRQYLKRVPIIAMTANAFAEDVEAARDAGMNAHMAKPISAQQLAEVLRRWLIRPEKEKKNRRKNRGELEEIYEEF